MSVTAYRTDALDLPPGSVEVPIDGLLARVRRPCPDHEGESQCVARRREDPCLVFWCPRGEHHFSIR